MKILKVIHGYPMRYNAGSEVYSQTLCLGLSDRHVVHVFTREEDPFGPDYRLRVDRDPDDSRISLHVVNNPRNKDRYRALGIDQRFVEVLEQVQPEIVHVGHLNHLSTSLLREEPFYPYRVKGLCHWIPHSCHPYNILPRHLQLTEAERDCEVMRMGANFGKHVCKR